MSQVEKLLLKVPVRTTLPIVFISGAPRSGSTITYQYFVELGDFCFFTNLERKHFRFPVVSAFLFRGAKKYSPTDENSYGHVPGKYAPSDGWEIFHRWFPYYYDPDQPMKKGGEIELYRTVAWFHRIYRKPFIVKNNANSLRINELRRVFPEAVFIHVERNRKEVIDSIIKGMTVNNITTPGLWGTGPRVDLIPSTVRTFDEKAEFQLDYISNYLSGVERITRINFDKDKMNELRENIKQIIQNLE